MSRDTHIRGPAEVRASVNPKAGKGKRGAQMRAFIAELAGQGRIAKVIETQSDGHATTIANDHRKQGRGDYLIAGGDGTLQQVVQGLLEVEDATPESTPRLSVLPLGTGNSFLRDFGSHDFDTAAQAIKDNQSQAVDVVAVDHDEGRSYSINIVSFGFTSEVGALTNKRFKRFGDAGYAFAVVSSLATLKPKGVRCSIDNAPAKNIDQVFVAFCNSRFTGGAMNMAPEAKLNDGKFQVIVAKPMSRAKLITTFPKIYSGTHTRSPLVDSFSASQATFENLPACDMMIDGEIIPMAMKSLRTIASAVNVVTPQ